MAEYSELRSLFDDASLINRTSVAVVIAAEVVIGEADTVPNHTQRVAWALTVLSNPTPDARKALKYILAVNKTATVADINTATDSTLQTEVDSLINLLAGV